MIIYPNAKINIGLNVIERRADGYHNIETIFYPIGLVDVLSVEVSLSCSDYSFSSSGFSIDSEPENNLVLKAYRLLQKSYDLPPVDISLEKQIPSGAGLGGGSSDAAFMLKALNELSELNLTLDDLELLATEIGADCPFFIRNRPVFATGIGNVFQALDFSLKGYFLLLVKPDVHVATAEAYRLLKPQKPNYKLEEAFKLPIEEWRGKIKNDFESSIFQNHPEIEKVKSDLYNLGAFYAAMSGSGSSVYGLFKTPPPIEELDFDECFVTGGYLE